MLNFLEENFFNRAHRAARERRTGHPAAVGAPIFQGAADKDDAPPSLFSDDVKWKPFPPRKNSRALIKDDEDHLPIPKKKKKEGPPPHKALEQTKLTKGVRIRPGDESLLKQQSLSFLRSTVAPVRKTCTFLFFSKVNEGPPTRPQTRTFFNCGKYYHHQRYREAQTSHSCLFCSMFSEENFFTAIDQCCVRPR